jgi:capsular exopolysaccharide synthesis family protein
MKRLQVEAVSQNSSFVNITFTGSNTAKVTDFLNALTRVYLEQNLEKKNRMALNTINFIDSQIQDVSDSLTLTESELQSFRSSHQVMDLNFQGQKTYEQMNQLQEQLANLEIQRQYFDYIRKYFNENKDVNDLAAPSAMNIDDVQINSLINQLMDLNSQRNKIVKGSATKNLFLKDIDTQIKNLKITILENINYSYNQLNIAIQNVNSRMSDLNKEIARMPRTERLLFGIERKFKLNDAIYTFLLQKKAEAQIARASNAPDYEVIDEAKYFMASQIAPRTTITYLIAIFLGLLIPLSYILARDFMNNKLVDPKDVEALTDLPIIGSILNNKMRSDTVIKDYPKSPIADSFRAVRTNLNFFAKGKEKLSILVTSSISGDGKSFCATNLASVYALFGKKTLLMGFDLRKPGLHLDFELTNDKGITSYLISEASISEIIQPTPIKNLDFIAAGPTPPNPMELIASEKTKDLFENLKDRYDYIIIDSAPIGAVADSFLLVEYVDVSIFVTRLNFTIKELISENLKNIERKSLSNFTVLINDFKLSKTSYGYVYHSKYYQQDTKSSRFRWLFGKKKKKRKKSKIKKS